MKAAQTILEELEKLPTPSSKTIALNCNHILETREGRLNYSENITNNLLIGSGVTEAVCL